MSGPHFYPTAVGPFGLTVVSRIYASYGRLGGSLSLTNVYPLRKSGDIADKLYLCYTFCLLIAIKLLNLAQQWSASNRYRKRHDAEKMGGVPNEFIIPPLLGEGEYFGPHCVFGEGSHPWVTLCEVEWKSYITLPCLNCTVSGPR